MNSILNPKQDSAVIIFAKYPEPGKVKTRLASSTDDVFAAKFYRICAEHIFREIHKIKISAFLFSPISDNKNLVENWAGKGFIYKQQIGNSLGDKMRNAFDEVFKSGFKTTVIIGTDVPGITAETIGVALNNLETTEVVISPSDDGGYSLLGMKKLFPILFSNDIMWSTDKVLPVTLAKMNEHNINYKILPSLHDVDTLEDLKRFLNRKNDSLQKYSTEKVHKDILRIAQEMNIKL